MSVVTNHVPNQELITNPILILTLGPTGSGKGSLPGKVINYLFTNPRSNTNTNTNANTNNNTSDKIKLFKQSFKKVIVDDLVESNESYYNLIKNFLHPYLKKHDSENKETKIQNVIKEILNDENINRTINFFNSAYFTSRKMPFCLNEKNKLALEEELKNNSVGSEIDQSNDCDSINDKKLEKYLKKRENIILESTGERFPDWLFDIYKDQIKEYNIIMCWSIVHFDTLIERNIGRFKQNLEKFIDHVLSTADSSNKPPNEHPNTPRLPEIREDFFIEKIINILKFGKFEETKICNEIKRYIESFDCKKITIILFDNNKPKSNETNPNETNPNKILSSKDTGYENMKEMIGEYLHKSDCVKGGGKKSKKNKKSRKNKKSKKKSKKIK